MAAGATPSVHLVVKVNSGRTADISNTATVSQTSTQNMNAWDNDTWVSIWSFKKSTVSGRA